jgi:hypothetical protein
VRLDRRFFSPEVIFFLKLYDGILITFSKLFCFPRHRVIIFPSPCIIRLQHKFIFSAHVSIMFTLCKKHVWVLIITTLHLVFEHMIKVFIRVVVLEQRPCLLVALISLLPLLPLSDLGNLTPPEVLIIGLGVMLFSGNRSVSHKHFLH